MATPPLQNRVTPFGALIATPERGLLLGNRGGRFHDPATRALRTRRWASKHWICCVLAFKGWKREVWKTGYTELFFLDEVTALSAGHRPCFFCQRERARDFVGRFGEAFGIAEPRAPQVDKRLHKERLASSGKRPAVAMHELSSLPDGAVVATGGNAYALRHGKALRWSFAGYGPPAGLGQLEDKALMLLTPQTTLAVLRHGFRPVWHPSAEA